MEDRFLVGALRSRDPDAIGAVHDAYADRLYDYCWFRLRNRDAAQVALRDTMMCADARIGELRDPARFGPWLYAIARIECRRRSISTTEPVEPDIPIARHDQDDVDLRLMAWRAVTCLPPLSQELLDLRHRRGLATPDIASVVGLPPRDVDDLTDQACALLQAAVDAEILAHEEPFECDERAAILRARRGDLDDELRDALVRHAAACGACARHLPRSVSAAKVYALLPRAAPPDLTRLAVTSCFTDPELAGYRLFAAARLPRFGAHGFPEQAGAGHAATLGRTPSRWPRALAALASALFTALVAAQAARWLADDTHGARVIRISPAVPRPRVPSPRPLGPPAVGRPVAAGLPLGAPDVPSVALRGVAPALPSTPGAGRLAVETTDLMLASGGAGTITVRAAGGPVTWWASAYGPVSLRPYAGTLAAGQAVAVTVRAPGGGPGRALVALEPGGIRVGVAWARPAPPRSTPPSSPPVSTSPPTTPTPSPRPSLSAPGRPSTSPAPPPTSSPPPARHTRPPARHTAPASSAPPREPSNATAGRRPDVPQSRPDPSPAPAGS